MTKVKLKVQTVESKERIRVTQTVSPIGCKPNQKRTLIGLGLNKIGSTRLLQNNPSTKGMISKVKHLVSITEVLLTE